MKYSAAVLVSMLLSVSFVHAVLTRDLTLGSTGTEVSELKNLLVRFGYASRLDSAVFDIPTQRAVKAFQAALNIPATGTVGVKTRAALNAFARASDSSRTSVQAKQVVSASACSSLPFAVAPRATSDRPDVLSAPYQVHILYVLPSDMTDEKLDTNGSIATSVGAFQSWLCRQTSGMGLNLDVTTNNMLDVTFVRLPVSNEILEHGTELSQKPNPSSNPYVRDDLEKRLAALGFNNPKKIYAVYYGGTANTSCGGGPWPPELVGHVAALYLKGRYGDDPKIPKCETNPLAQKIQSPGYMDFSMLHEIFHTLGMVPSCAPHHTLRGHSSDSTADIMYQGNGSWDYAHLTVDPGYDDYYKTQRTDCATLERSAFLSGGGTMIPQGW